MAANSAIDRRDLDTLIQVLHDLVGFHSLECHDFAAPLYMEELSNIKAEKKVGVGFCRRLLHMVSNYCYYAR